MYENNNIKDGLPVFGIEGTFQISNIIYVLNDQADDALLLTLAAHGYAVEYTSDRGYAAILTHQQTQSEILDEFIKAQGHATDKPSSFVVSLEYSNHPKLKLNDPDIHSRIIRSASQRCDISYYNRSGDHMDDLVIGRMSAFVQHLVDVPFEKWKEFLRHSQYDHSQDFIRRLAHWASVNSNKTVRHVRYDGHGSEVTVNGAETFVPIKSDRANGPKPFFRR